VSAILLGVVSRGWNLKFQWLRKEL